MDDCRLYGVHWKSIAKGRDGTVKEPEISRQGWNLHLRFVAREVLCRDGVETNVNLTFAETHLTYWNVSSAVTWDRRKKQSRRKNQPSKNGKMMGLHEEYSAGLGAELGNL